MSNNWGAVHQYKDTNRYLFLMVDKLIKWNYNQPLTDAEVDYFTHLSADFSRTANLLLSNGYEFNVHREWKYRIDDIERYINDYLYGSTLSEVDIEDLNQALYATKFITMDLKEIRSDRDFYKAMHDEHHEMVERVKERLAMKY
ncbi:hypothetical protein [Ureibacillus acetophenoni]|uniref:Uncharacterized protein n=1 Tax=Ureibacillus acetophenoni TaxID=614649 RepID=A0A285UI77_9BACL|nr:hypothetical protein [Ureibacillus acetophenoni]SOC41512.1 hypothetical protein SAMN05877842_110123 [Ureibacillus acetophenoni]